MKRITRCFPLQPFKSSLEKMIERWGEEEKRSREENDVKIFFCDNVYRKNML